MNSVDKILDIAISKLKTIADVDTVVGKPIETPDGKFVLPVSKVSIGFVAGGGEYSEVTLAGQKKNDKDFPFAGGSGAGVCISPIAFLSVSSNETKIFLIDNKSPVEKIAELVPDVVKGLVNRFVPENKSGNEKEEVQKDKTDTHEKKNNKVLKVKIENAKE